MGALIVQRPAVLGPKMLFQQFAVPHTQEVR